MRGIKTQSDIVAATLLGEETEVKEKIKLPDLDKLHLKPKDEIAEVLVNLLKSRRNITSIHWDIGSPFIIITSAK